MFERRQDEFRELERKAKSFLEDPDRLPEQRLLKRYSLRFRIWHYPSFDRQTSLNIYTPRSEQEADAPCIVRKVLWDSPFDSRRLGLPMEGLKYGFSTKPTIALWQITLSDPAFRIKLDRFSRLSLPLLVSDVVGLDGERYGIETFGFHHISVSWWCDGPDEWKPLIRWSEEIRDAIENNQDEAVLEIEV